MPPAPANVIGISKVFPLVVISCVPLVAPNANVLEDADRDIPVEIVRFPNIVALAVGCNAPAYPVKFTFLAVSLTFDKNVKP